ncbi:ubiquinone biosynthesis protein COQ9, mitochondrial-like [Halichondria panicea]|uniref:ubiquinone biosynthesis protein COQ9, mitochondrial-like n=1 Tax=Halichondria panicea TaxID=6063 RepID=UPI00312B8F2B
MSMSSVWKLACVVGRGTIQRARGTVSGRPLTYSAPLSASFSTTIRRCTEESSSSSESDTDTDSDTDSEAATHGSPLMSETEEDSRVAVLKACLYLVREGGWSAAVLAEGVKKAGFEEGEERELFPNGPGDLVNLFEQQCNAKLYRYMEKQKEAGVVGPKIIQPSVEHKLKMLSPYIEKWPQAMSLKVQPQVAPTALENVSLMVDDIWYMAGDQTTDVSWYTKRGVLGAIYTSTELYMIQDESDGFADTWRFLDHQLQGVHHIGGIGRGIMDIVRAGLDNMKGTVGDMTEKK